MASHVSTNSHSLALPVARRLQVGTSILTAIIVLDALAALRLGF